MRDSNEQSSEFNLRKDVFMRNRCLGVRLLLQYFGIYVWCVHLQRGGLCLLVPWLTDGMPFNQPGSPLVPGTPAVSSNDKLWPLAAGFSITDDASPSRLYQEDIRRIRPRSASSTPRRNPRCWGGQPLQVCRGSNRKSLPIALELLGRNPSERGYFHGQHMERVTAGPACWRPAAGRRAASKGRLNKEIRAG